MNEHRDDLRMLGVIFAAFFLASCMLLIAIGPQAGASYSMADWDDMLRAGTPPDVPRNLVVDQGPGFNWLWWEHPISQGTDLIKRYEVWRGVSSGGEILHDWVRVGSTEHEGTYLGGLEFYNDSTDITLDVEYFYHVIAVSDTGRSGPSNEAAATPSLRGDVPGAPDLTGSNGVYSAKLNWDWPEVASGSPPARFFFVYRDPAMHWSLDWMRMTSYSDMAGYYARVGAAYNYTVTAVNTYGHGAGTTATVVMQGTGSLPSAARNITGSGGNGTATLAWDSPLDPSSIGFDHFDIYRATDADGPFLKIDETAAYYYGYGGIFFDEGLANGVTYFYKVAANNSNGIGDFSDLVSVTPSDLPFEVGFLDAYPGDNTVLLAWGAAHNATGYDIYRSETSGTGFSLLASLPPSSTYTDYTALNGNTYHYYLVPKQLSTVGNSSEEAWASPSNGTAPPAPTGMVATPSRHGVEVYVPEQTVNSLLIGYEVYRNGSAPGTWELREKVDDLWAEEGFSWYDPHSISYINYQYEVRLQNLYGWGANSTTLTSFSSPSGECPDPVADLAASDQPGKVHLEWSAPYAGTAKLLNYQVERNGSDGRWHPIDSFYSNASILEFEDGSGVLEVAYQYRVKVSNNYGEASAPSNVVDGTASRPTTGPPSSPRDLEAIPSAGKVTLNWSPPIYDGGSSITGYEVYRNDQVSPLAILGAGARSYVDGNGTVGVAYAYWVVAMNAFYRGENSSVLNATALPQDGGEGFDNSMLFIGAGVVGAVAIGIAAYLLSRKRR